MVRAGREAQLHPTCQRLAVEVVPPAGQICFVGWQVEEVPLALFRADQDMSLADWERFSPLSGASRFSANQVKHLTADAAAQLGSGGLAGLQAE